MHAATVSTGGSTAVGTASTGGWTVAGTAAADATLASRA
jgi:hypothetical protein